MTKETKKKKPKFENKGRKGRVGTKQKIKMTLRMCKALSMICGVTIPLPATNGYKTSNYRNLILANEEDIMASPLLSKAEAEYIISITK